MKLLNLTFQSIFQRPDSMEINFETKKGTILVTGGLGFIGSHFMDLVLKDGFKVINVDKITYASFTLINPYLSKRYPDRYRFIKKDINNLEALPDCEYLVHFAAESHVDNSIRDGSVFVKSNVLGTQRLLDLIVKNRLEHTNGAPIFIYVSTDEVFGDIKEGFFKESDRINPSNPYSASKAAAELLIAAYSRTYGLPFKITRTTNNYGDRQHPEKLIPNCMLRIFRNERIRIHGSGKQIRNWIHVKDNCRAIYAIMLKGRLGEAYHISTPEEFSVSEVAKKILEVFGKPYNESTIQHIEDRAGQDVRYALDAAKLIQELHWSPEFKFEEQLNVLAQDYRVKYEKGKWPYVNY